VCVCVMYLSSCAKAALSIKNTQEHARGKFCLSLFVSFVHSLILVACLRQNQAYSSSVGSGHPFSSK
jgi:hypothetical protein